LVDIGFGLIDQNIFRLGLDIGEQNLKNQDDEKYKANIHYNLANSYLSLFGLAKRNTGIEAIPQSENLQKAKLHFREALKFSE
jgi:hypothetical protein